jgi:hypothetical protein
MPDVPVAQRLGAAQLTALTQKPFVQGVPLQHCAELWHCCPYCAHVVPPPGVVVPPSGVPGVPGVAAAPHVPAVAPALTLHGSPAQQSAVVVQLPPVGWHATPEHTSTPAAFAVHGLLQQSALEAHTVPAGGGFVQSTAFPTRQRGMPRLSCTQFVFTCWTVPEQQRSVAWHENAASRQIEPAGLHLLPLSQRPTMAPAALLHVVFASAPSGRPAEPQQSLSF